jgi:hypothetical protein
MPPGLVEEQITERAELLPVMADTTAFPMTSVAFLSPFDSPFHRQRR